MAEFVYPTLAKDENIIDDYHGTKVGTKVICIIKFKAVQCLLILYIFEGVQCTSEPSQAQKCVCFFFGEVTKG